MDNNEELGTEGVRSTGSEQGVFSVSGMYR